MTITFIMRLFYFISLLFFLVNDSYSYSISRGKFIRNNIIHFTLNKDKLFQSFDNRNALVISCDKIGKKVLDDFNKANIRTSVTTTKPKRFNELSSIADEVVIIPQMEIGKDEIMQDAIYNNDVIIIADTISIFSVHTFMRTCKRIANAIKNKGNHKKTTVILVSSVNVYGVHTNGEFVNEETPTYLELDRTKIQNWQLNHYGIASIMRIAEDYLLELMDYSPNIRTVVLRTSTIWDDSNIDAIRDKGFIKKKYSKVIGNSYMSISFTDEISNCMKWIIENDNMKGCFNLVSNSVKRKDFYDNLFDIMKRPRIKWVNDDSEINKDFYFSMDENPLLPNAQRFNMRVNCNKIKMAGYKKLFELS